MTTAILIVMLVTMICLGALLSEQDHYSDQQEWGLWHKARDSQRIAAIALVVEFVLLVVTI
jgi:hypothetical protein